jgi:hypothetical protein
MFGSFQTLKKKLINNTNVFYIDMNTYIIYKNPKTISKSLVKVLNDDFDILGQELYFDKIDKNVRSKVYGFLDSEIRIFRSFGEKTRNYNIKPIG